MEISKVEKIMSSAGVGFSPRKFRRTYVNRIRRRWLILETVTLAGLILIFNIVASDIGLFGFVTSAGDPASFIPLSAPAFLKVLPWLNFWWGAALIINLTNLFLGRRNPLTSLVDLGLGFLGMGVLTALMVLGPSFILEPSWAAEQKAAGVNLESIELRLLPLLNISIFVILTIAFLSLLGATIRKSIFVIKTWRLEGQSIDILLQLSLFLAAALMIAAPLTTFEARATLSDFLLPMALILGLIVVKTTNPKLT